MFKCCRPSNSSNSIGTKSSHRNEQPRTKEFVGDPSSSVFGIPIGQMATTTADEEFPAAVDALLSVVLLSSQTDGIDRIFGPSSSIDYHGHNHNQSSYDAKRNNNTNTNNHTNNHSNSKSNNHSNSKSESNSKSNNKSNNHSNSKSIKTTKHTTNINHTSAFKRNDGSDDIQRRHSFCSNSSRKDHTRDVSEIVRYLEDSLKGEHSVVDAEVRVLPMGCEPSACADVFQRWLSMLPEPLFPECCYKEIIATVKEENREAERKRRSINRNLSGEFSSDLPQGVLRDPRRLVSVVHSAPHSLLKDHLPVIQGVLAVLSALVASVPSNGNSSNNSNNHNNNHSNNHSNNHNNNHNNHNHNSGDVDVDGDVDGCSNGNRSRGSNNRRGSRSKNDPDVIIGSTVSSVSKYSDASARAMSQRAFDERFLAEVLGPLMIRKRGKPRCSDEDRDAVVAATEALIKHHGLFEISVIPSPRGDHRGMSSENTNSKSKQKSKSKDGRRGKKPDRNGDDGVYGQALKPMNQYIESDADGVMSGKRGAEYCGSSFARDIYHSAMDSSDVGDRIDSARPERDSKREHIIVDATDANRNIFGGGGSGGGGGGFGEFFPSDGSPQGHNHGHKNHHKSSNNNNNYEDYMDGYQYYSDYAYGSDYSGPVNTAKSDGFLTVFTSIFSDAGNTRNDNNDSDNSRYDNNNNEDDGLFSMFLGLFSGAEEEYSSDSEYSSANRHHLRGGRRGGRARSGKKDAGRRGRKPPAVSSPSKSEARSQRSAKSTKSAKSRNSTTKNKASQRDRTSAVNSRAKSDGWFSAIFFSGDDQDQGYYDY